MPTKIFSWRVRDSSLWFLCWGELFLCYSAVECEILLTADPCKQHFCTVSFHGCGMCYVILFCFVNYSCIGQERREMLTTQKLNNFCGFYGICWLFRKAKPPCKNQLVGAYKHCYDPMTPWKSFQNRPGLYTLRSRSILEGFVCSHQIITMLISPHQLEPTGWFSAKGLFPSCSFFNMPTNPIIFHSNLNYFDVILLFSITVHP